MSFIVEQMPSPLGKLLVVARGQSLCALAFEDRWDHEHKALARRMGGEALDTGQVAPAIRGALQAYFDGDLTAIDHVSVDPGGTSFQQGVWAMLRRVPAGTTQSYADIAAAIGQPGATRAVGVANGRNPIAIVIPCHRVIGKDGKLHGYSAGVERKRWLLDHEHALSPLFAMNMP